MDINEKLSVFDIGVGTGVLSALLLHKHADSISHVVGTDINPRAISCARENLTRLECSDLVKLECTQTVFPSELDHPRADLIVCNPPWLPAHDHADREGPDANVYDFSNLLESLIAGAKDRLKNERSEVWLLMSDLAELLELRRINYIEDLAECAGLRIVDRLSTNKDDNPIKAEERKKEKDPTAVVEAARQESRVILYRMMMRQD